MRNNEFQCFASEKQERYCRCVYSLSVPRQVYRICSFAYFVFTSVSSIISLKSRWQAYLSMLSLTFFPLVQRSHNILCKPLVAFSNEIVELRIQALTLYTRDSFCCKLFIHETVFVVNYSWGKPSNHN